MSQTKTKDRVQPEWSAALLKSNAVAKFLEKKQISERQSYILTVVYFVICTINKNM